MRLEKREFSGADAATVLDSKDETLRNIVLGPNPIQILKMGFLVAIALFVIYLIFPNYDAWEEKNNGDWYVICQVENESWPQCDEVRSLVSQENIQTKSEYINYKKKQSEWDIGYGNNIFKITILFVFAVTFIFIFIKKINPMFGINLEKHISINFEGRNFINAKIGRKTMKKDLINLANGIMIRKCGEYSVVSFYYSQLLAKVSGGDLVVLNSDETKHLIKLLKSFDNLDVKGATGDYTSTVITIFKHKGILNLNQ